MRYNRYMTDDRNQNLGEGISKKNFKFCNYNNCNKTAIYNYVFMKPKYCFKHKNEYMGNIEKHILCPYHYKSHSHKIKSPECRIRSSCIGLLDISFIFDQIWSIFISL